MIVCEVTNAIITATIPLALWTGHLSILQLYGVSFLAGTAFVFFNVAEFAALPSVVAPNQLPAATAQNQVTFGVTGLLGPPLGGILYQVARALPFLADTISYLMSFGSLLLIKTRFQTEREAAPGRVLADIREGLSWLWHHPVLRPFTALGAGLNLLAGGYPLLIIVLAREERVSPAGIGIVFAIASIGGLLGAVAGPWMQQRVTFGQVTIGYLASGSLLFPLYAVIPNVFVIAGVSAVVFAGGPIFNVVTQTYRFRVTPDALLGRVNGTGRVIAWGTAPLGATLTGLSLQHFGTTTTVWLIAGGYAGLATIAALSAPIRSATQGEIAMQV